MSHESHTASAPRRQVKRTTRLVAGAFSMLFLGLVYAWSIFVEPIARGLGVDTAVLSNVFQTSMVSFCVGCILSSHVSRTAGPQRSMGYGAGLMAFGFLGTAAIAGSGVVAVYVFYGVLCGLGCGFGYNAVVSTVNLWFPDRVGFSSGVLLMSFGSGALVLGSGVDVLMSSFGWQVAFVLLACVGVILLPATSRVMEAPSSEELLALAGMSTGAGAKQDGRSSSAGAGPNAGSTTRRKSFTTRQMLTSPLFALSVLWYMATAIAALTLTGSSKQSALALGADAALATLLVGLVSIGNGASRIVYGLIRDRFGLLRMMRVVSACGVVATLMLAVACTIGSVPLFVAGAVAMGLAYGGVPVYSSSFALERYGPEHYASNYAVSTSCTIPSSLVSMVAAPLLRGWGGDGMLYAVCFVVALAGAALLWPFARRFKRDMAEVAKG